MPGTIDALLDALVHDAPIERICVVAAHPDDETLFAGLCLADRDREVHLVHLTDGAPIDPWFAKHAGCDSRESYAALRARELDAALDVLGLARASRHALGLRDQEVTDALPDVVRELVRVLRSVRPTLVITHAYEGGHPDHDAASFATRAALELLARDAAACPLGEFAGYHAAANAGVETAFLRRPTDARRRARTATPEEHERKESALRRFASQREVISGIAWGTELFRPAPVEDFGGPPHEGTLHYERWRWRVDGPSFRASVARAASALDVQTVLP